MIPYMQEHFQLAGTKENPKDYELISEELINSKKIFSETIFGIAS
jgi:hypothetical protein